MDTSRNLRFEAFGLIRLIGFVATAFFLIWLITLWNKGTFQTPFDLFFASSWGKHVWGEMLTSDQLTGPGLAELLAIYLVQRYWVFIGGCLTFISIWYICMLVVYQLAFIICYGFAEYRKEVSGSLRKMLKRKTISKERQGPESEPHA